MTDQPSPLQQARADAQRANPATARVPARLARETTADNPWPLALLSTKIDQYVAKMTPVWVEAQVVQLNRRAGMSFLTLRDLSAEISLRASMYRRDLVASEQAMGTELSDGIRVVVHGRPTFWTRSGSFQLQVDQIRLVGTGDLLARIEQLRRVLAAEGLFAPERKRPLPFLPRVVGLVCGRDAKARDDVITNARLRWPGLPFEVREVAVQGVHAVSQVGAAIAELDARPEVDVIVVARGGGSVEDLLSFSDEGLVRAAAMCRTPLVSAIGHETDRPLLDDVADYRASTPTDAARRIVPDLAEETVGLDQARSRIRTALARRVTEEQTRLDRVRERPVMTDPTVIVRDKEADLSQGRERLRRALLTTLDLAGADLRAETARLTALSPQGVLDRGYAILRKPGVGVVTSSEELKKGDLIEGVLAHGRMVAQVVGATKPSPTPSTAPAER
ncbi:MAG: exodeoxyribonuclease VII large subunit [Actinomyces urogenitalis]|nr:exodeoxyribonuclease VII large subunit [Actinomyces urogenitalis]MDU0864759.1 exodeoxyribonuclease VII large subunit [Actinomyces urogenitalis]MDU0875306.1 exodeoxyribonuclease VII large subunit [Actinomyces urogenitalis]MDU1565082.1 exodeoxyribonuclease VII large subunit [Actinomyces urogenitalis]MDU1640376.1 exodeoxyribonuclease VII large subunit [Actinomyces urogenitalis]MDU5874925.1 exodeoxyribonuclease VII large subunit [Actinomyces urogenitalis]